MNSDKSNIPLVRLGDIRKTLKTKFKVIPGNEIKFRTKVKDDFRSCKIVDYTAKVIRLYIQLRTTHHLSMCFLVRLAAAALATS